MVNGIDERKLRPALVVCWCLFLGLCLLFSFGCAVRHLPNGTTAPATNFEQILAWNAAAAQANDGFADNVIGLQRAGFLSVAEARIILVKQAAIAGADRRITDRISAAALCASQQAGSNATAAQLDAAAANCAQVSGPGISADIALILGSIGDLNTSGLLAVKDTAKRQALSDLLATMQSLVEKISSSLVSQGVVKAAAIGSRPLILAEVQPWR